MFENRYGRDLCRSSAIASFFPVVKPPEANTTDPVATTDEDAGDELAAIPASLGVLAKFPDNNSVIDDFNIGEYKRELRDGQSIEKMIDRMAEAIAQDKDQEEFFERPFTRVKQLCGEANTKKTLIDCDDEVRKLHGRFFKE